MKINSVLIKNQPPIKFFQVNDLSDFVVIGGPNGVGKTCLLKSIINKIHNVGSNPGVQLEFGATYEEEKVAWNGAETVSTLKEGAQIQKLLHRRQKRGETVGGVLYFESTRQIKDIQKTGYELRIKDPFEEEIDWNTNSRPLESRFNDTVTSIFRKIRFHKQSLMDEFDERKARGEKFMPLDYPDPLEKFKSMFSVLFPGKVLGPLDDKDQKITFELAGSFLSIGSFSSGEKEIFQVVFDLLLRSPSDCIVLFDEPELHLHAEMLRRLTSALRQIGPRNQFIFCTHSAEMISSSINDTVVLITPPDGENNQAIVVRQDASTQAALKTLGHSVGVISLGKKIVLIEGESSSLDKLIYDEIGREYFSELTFVSAGGRRDLESFTRVAEIVLKKTIWGVEFFALCDGDTDASEEEMGRVVRETEGRLQRLPRYHIESYFLDQNVYARMFETMGYEAGDWRRNPEKIEEKFRELAREILPYTVSIYVSKEFRLRAGAISIKPKGCDKGTLDELMTLFAKAALLEKKRIEQELNEDIIRDYVKYEYERLSEVLEKGGDDWKRIFPSKQLLNLFAGKVDLKMEPLKRHYIKSSLQNKMDSFKEILDILATFH